MQRLGGRASDPPPAARSVGCLVGAFAAGLVAPAVTITLLTIWSIRADSSSAAAREEEVRRAIADEDVERLTTLLESGADAGESAVDPPIQDAVRRDNPELVRVLLHHGAGVESPTAGGWTLLFDAAVDGSPETVRILLQHGADPCSTTTRSGHNGMRPLDVARRRRDVSVIRLLAKATESCTRH